MADAKQFTEKIVVSHKLTVGNFPPAKGVSAKDLIIADHLQDGVLEDHSANSETVASDVAAVDQPLLMAKADIDAIASGESAAVVSDAVVTYTDHIAYDVAEVVSDQPELLAMNTVQHISDSAVLADENGGGGGGIPWMWVGAAAVAGGGLGVALGSNHGGNDAAPAAGAPTVHVVVERFGAFIDTDKDGMKDIDERTAAVFSEGGNADLVNDTVTVHFNNVPLNAINLTGFTGDDKIQFDVGSFQDHHLLDTASNSITGLSIGELSTSFSFSGPSITLYRYQVDWEFSDFNGKANHSGYYGLRVSSIEKSVSGTETGAIAYWRDPENALNYQANVLHPLYNNSNTDEIIDNLNDSTATHGLVEFIWPADEEHVDVIINVSDGNAYIDQNGDGILNVSDYIGGGCGSYEPAVFSGGNADLASKDVTIHFHEYANPTLDLSGFTSNDLIEIDGDFLNITRHAQTTINTFSTVIAKNLMYAETEKVFGGASNLFVRTENSSEFFIGIISSGGGVGISKSVGYFDPIAYNPLTSGNVVFVIAIPE